MKPWMGITLFVEAVSQEQITLVRIVGSAMKTAALPVPDAVEPAEGHAGGRAEDRAEELWQGDEVVGHNLDTRNSILLHNTIEYEIYTETNVNENACSRHEKNTNR